MNSYIFFIYDLYDFFIYRMLKAGLKEHQGVFIYSLIWLFHPIPSFFYVLNSRNRQFGP